MSDEGGDGTCVSPKASTCCQQITAPLCTTQNTEGNQLNGYTGEMQKHVIG